MNCSTLYQKYLKTDKPRLICGYLFVRGPWQSTRLHIHSINSCNQVMDERSHLFKDLIRCNLLDILQPIKFLTLLYKARGFLSFCLLQVPEFLPLTSQHLRLGRRGSQGHLQSLSSNAIGAQQPCRQHCIRSLAAWLMLAGKRAIPLASLSTMHHLYCS